MFERKPATKAVETVAVVEAPAASAKPVVKEELVYVSIPEENMYNERHPDIWINSKKFASGKTHAVTAEIATELQSILRRYNKSQMRVMQGAPDREAQRIADQRSPDGID